jgi:hypothetical protein
LKRTLHIVLVLLVAAACQGPRVIPKDTLTDIFVDMFLADQMVRDKDIPQARMDTLLVYEAVFEKYGYDTDDYLYTVRKSLRDPERFSKVFEEVAKRLEVEVEDLNEIIERQNTLAVNQGKHPPVLSILAPFSKESFYAGLPRVERDTSRFGAWFRLVAVQEDTLMIPVDSVKVAKDPVEDEKADDEDDEAEVNESVLIQETRSRVPVRGVSEKFLKENQDVEEHAE